MGGVILRSALQYLEEYKEKFHLFMTLSSPHLGYMYNSNKLVDLGTLKFSIKKGMWYLQKFEDNRSIKELFMKDASNLEDTFLYQLTMKQVIFNITNLRHFLISNKLFS